MNLVEVVLGAVDHRITLGLPPHHDVRFVGIVELVRRRIRLKQLKSMARILDVLQYSSNRSLDGGNGGTARRDDVARCSVRCDNVDRALLVASFA